MEVGGGGEGCMIVFGGLASVDDFGVFGRLGVLDCFGIFEDAGDCAGSETKSFSSKDSHEYTASVGATVVGGCVAVLVFVGLLDMRGLFEMHREAITDTEVCRIMPR